jgi:glycosyltransferase involved in cell wall biosynthesis
LNQTFTDFESIVVGDGPPNSDTKDAMNGVTDERVRYHELPTNGPYPAGKNAWYVSGAHALNKALELADGDYIAHLDDDDEWKPNHLQDLVTLIESGGYDFVYSQCLVKYPDFVKKPDRVIGSPPPLKSGHICHMSILYKSSFKNIKYVTDCSEPGDWVRINKIQSAANKIGFLETVTCVWNASGAHYKNARGIKT